MYNIAPMTRTRMTTSGSSERGCCRGAGRFPVRSSMAPIQANPMPRPSGLLRTPGMPPPLLRATKSDLMCAMMANSGMANSGMANPSTSNAAPRGADIIDALKAARVEFVAAVPDIVTSAGLLWPISRDGALRLIRLCKEDEGVSICTGLAFCGRRAVLLMQQTGLMDSLNAIRAIAVEYQQPVCMIVGLLGKEPDR